MVVGPDVFRNLLGRFATGVSVVTARDSSGKPHGMTASAVASVSLVPPLISVCIDRATDFHDVIAGAEDFSLSFLSANQEHVSQRFATRNIDRFEGIGIEDDGENPPIILGTVAHLRCLRRDEVAAGDHTIFVGEVVDGGLGEGTPLIHYAGRYTSTR